MEKTRPKHLNLFKIRLPLPGWVSILHRVSGFGLFICLPLLLWLLDNSLHSRSSFEHFRGVIAMPLMKLLLLGLIWALFHHLCAGLRYLALDFHWGIELAPARNSSMLVLAVSLLMTAIAGVLLW
jgi:succinate dehydrogenase / fumarate reductase cytochrome b subunit